MNLLSCVAHQGRPGRTAAPPPPRGSSPLPPPRRRRSAPTQKSASAQGRRRRGLLPREPSPPHGFLLQLDGRASPVPAAGIAGRWGLDPHRSCADLHPRPSPRLGPPAVSLLRWCAGRASQGGQWPDPALRRPDLVLHRPMRPALGRHASTARAPAWPAARSSRASAAARGRQAQLRHCVGDNEGPAMRVAWRAQWAGSSRLWRRCYIFREPLAMCRRGVLAALVCSVTPLSSVNGAGSAGRQRLDPLELLRPLC